MMVDRPVRENDVGFLRRKNPGERVIVLRVESGLPIDLPGECSSSGKDSTSFSRLGRPDRGALIERRCAAVDFAAIEVEWHHLVAEVAEARDRATAPALRVAWMTAGHDNLQLQRGLSKCGSGGDKTAAGDGHS